MSREDGPSKIAAAWHIRVCTTVHRACDRTVEHSPRNVGFVLLGESGASKRRIGHEIVETSDHIRIEQGIERLLLFERRAAPARPWAPDGLEFDRPTCVTLCYTGLEPATRACDRMHDA